MNEEVIHTDAVSSEIAGGVKKIDEQQFIIFELDGEWYGVDIALIEEVIKVPPVTPVPNAPEAIVGIFHLRGRVIVVLDLGRQFRLPRQTSGATNYLLVSSYEKNHFGILIDKVRNVVYVVKKDIQPIPEVVAAHARGRYIVGMFLLPEPKKVTKKKFSPSIMIEPVKKILTPQEEEKPKLRPVLIVDLALLLREGELLSVEQSISPQTSQVSPGGI